LQAQAKLQQEEAAMVRSIPPHHPVNAVITTNKPVCNLQPTVFFFLFFIFFFLFFFLILAGSSQAASAGDRHGASLANPIV
jgi:hypothetical protein